MRDSLGIRDFDENVKEFVEGWRQAPLWERPILKVVFAILKVVFVLLLLLAVLMSHNANAQQPEDSLPEPIQLARMNVINIGGGVPAAGGECDTESAEFLSTEPIMYGDASANSALDATTKANATAFPLSADAQITHYTVLMAKAAANNVFSVRCYLAEDNSNVPDSNNEIAGTDVTISVTADDWLPHLTYDNRQFTLSSPVSLSGETTYWLVCYPSSLTTGFPYFAFDSTSTGAYATSSADSRASWAARTANATYLRSKVFGCYDD